MILLILGLLYLDYIPKEFQQLRRKALKSSQLKLLSHEEPEPIILPGKPFITDSFVGSVLHPIFGITNKELKGFAISKTKEHIALIADRETENGRSILNKKSVFFGLGNVSVSLTEKFADDGEVAIFNITDIDPLAAFYNFDMKLSPLSYDCKAELGKSFGARCWASFNKSWDQANNKPKEIDLSDVITNQSIREKIKIYVGAKANGEASAIIEKRGASLQAKFDGSLKVLAGAGFHIDQIHYTLPRKEFKIDPIVFGEAISDLSFDIPHEIDISRLVSIDIHKGYTISTKHGISPDFRKEIKVGTISTDSEEKGNNIEENYIKADFKATFSIWPAIKIDLSVGSSINFGAEVGPELGIDVNLGIDKEQCTYPGLYGTFTPFVNSTCVFSGSLKIANLQLLKFTKPISHRIYEKVLHSGCFFDGASSKELEKDYIQVERNRTVIYIENPKLINKSMSMLEKYEPIFFVGQTSTNEKPFYLGPATVYFSDDDKVYHYRDFVYVPEYNNFDNISIIPLEKDVIDEDDITFDYPFDRVSATTKALSFDIISQNSNAIDMGNQVIFANSGDIKNFRSKFISGTVKSQPIGLILHNKKDGYFNDPFKYVIHDEINNDVDEIIFNWAKLEVIEVQGKEPFNLYFSRKYEDTLYLKGVNGYLLAENNQSMSSVFIEKPYLVKINPDYYDSDFVGYFQLTTQNRESIGFINITKKEATHNSQFTKELGSYKITFKANSTVDDVEYIVNLNNIEVNESEKDSLKGVVTRIFEPHDSDYKPKFYEGKETPCVFIMQANEIYGILRFHFVDPEYDMKKNNNVYAFIKLPGSIPLLTSSHCIDEKDSCYSIKLEYGKSKEEGRNIQNDISNDGTVLLEFNSNKNDGFDVNSKSILADAKIPEVYPGIEEIYNVEDDKNDKLAQSRFNINCRRQIIPGREDKIYLTKPWKGTIKKVAVNLEQQNINIKIAHRSWKGYTHIFMLADGLPSNNLESIPFNPNIIAKEHDSDVRKTLNEIGIDIQGKSIQKAIEDKELVFDNEGNIQVKNEFFKEDMLKNNINKNSIPMIGIPQGHYTLKHVKCEIKSKKKACSGTTEVRDPDYDDDVCADPMSNFDIKSAYLGVSTVFDDLKFSYKLMKNARKALGHLIPSPNFLHTGIWVGPSDATNETLGTILTYGNYHSNGRDPTFISKDGARAYSMTLSEFKDMFDASKTIKLTVQSNITLYNLIDEIKSGDKWNANHYSWALNNCQHFTTLCLNLLKTKRTSPNDNDWIDLPKTVLNTLKSNEK